MDCCLSYAKPKFFSPSLPSGAHGRPISFSFRLRIQRGRLIVVAGAGGKCEFSGLNTPLQPRTPAGKFLTGVLLDDPECFQVAAGKELQRLAAERDEATARLQLSLGSDEALLHRRIAELKTEECQAAVEDVMYMFILQKFYEMRVHLIPRLSQCVHNGRLEIWPSKDAELESIHGIEALEMVREHLFAVAGCKANSTVRESWTPTEIPRLRLCRLYAASILYGFFLKSASLRHHLEWGLDTSRFEHGFPLRAQVPVSDMCSLGSDYIAFGRVTSPRSNTSISQVSYFVDKRSTDLKLYVMGFDPETIQMCAKPQSKEAMDLIERHSCALFGDEKTGLPSDDELISISFASVKRFVLEAVAFGLFLWEAENCVNAVYKLEEN